MTGETIYARYGDWPGWLAAGCVLLGLAVRLTAPAPRG
jgi:apolipoprotein N-acyltransferase